MALHQTVLTKQLLPLWSMKSKLLSQTTHASPKITWQQPVLKVNQKPRCPALDQGRRQSASLAQSPDQVCSKATGFSTKIQRHVKSCLFARGKPICRFENGIPFVLFRVAQPKNRPLATSLLSFLCIPSKGVNNYRRWSAHFHRIHLSFAYIYTAFCSHSK